MNTIPDFVMRATKGRVTTEVGVKNSNGPVYTGINLLYLCLFRGAHGTKCGSSIQVLAYRILSSTAIMLVHGQAVIHGGI